MSTLSIVYPRTQGSKFDYAYYRTRHMQLVAERWGPMGLAGGEALLGSASADGSDAPYYAIGIVHFETEDQLRAALASDAGADLIADIAIFTDVKPDIQINDRFVPRN